MNVLIQSAWAAVRYDKIMARCYEELKTRIGKQKAIVAIARKLVVKVFYYLKKAVA